LKNKNLTKIIGTFLENISLLANASISWIKLRTGFVFSEEIFEFIVLLVL